MLIYFSAKVTNNNSFLITYYKFIFDNRKRVFNILYIESFFSLLSILHLATTIVIQYFLMRDLEKLTGSLRIALIYLGSGVAGNLGSAIFVPYRADVSELILG